MENMRILHNVQKVEKHFLNFANFPGNYTTFLDKSLKWRIFLMKILLTSNYLHNF